MRKARALVIALLAVSHAHAEAPQQQLTQTLQSLAESKETEAQLQKRLKQTQAELEALQERSAGLAERLQVSERRVTTQEKALAAANQSLSEKQKDFEARKADYAATVVNLLRLRELPPTALFTSPENIQQLMRTATVLEETNQAIATKAARLKQDMGQLKSLKTDAAAKDARTKAEKITLSAEQAALAKELEARKKLEAKLSADHAKAEDKVAELSRESQSLQELIGKLDVEEKRAAAAAAASKVKPAKTENIRAFSNSKGSARAPVAGDVVHQFGDRKNANETYRGVVFRARAGATVVAPYDGQIVFTGPFRDYGRMVLIKHKNGYISLIAGLGQVSASLNQPAIRGEPIGTMPDADSPEAYVELRDKEAKPIDPGDWFANVSGKLAQQ